MAAIDYIHRNKMYVVGGLIVGNPDDTRESIEANLELPAVTSTGRTFSTLLRTLERQ